MRRKEMKLKSNKSKINKQSKEIFTNKNGITIIALVITIIVLLILAGVTISTLIGDSGIITRANEAALSTELSKYKEQLELYKANKYIQNNNFIEETLTAGKENLSYNTQEQEEVGKGNIKTIIQDISDEYLEKLEVIKGELLINTQDRSEIKVAQSLGIQVNPYDIRDGVLWSSNGNLLLMDEKTGSLTIPDSVTAIGEGAFANLEGLKTIIIPSTVKRIEKNAFTNNSTLETVIMQEKENADGSIDGVEYIGNAAFKDCSNLTTAQMANSVTVIEDSAFYNDKKLKNINISKSLKILKTYVFTNCGLVNIEVPEGIISIYGACFASCTNLEKIKLPSTLETIDSTAFNSCSKLKNIDIAEGNTNFKFDGNGFLLGNNETVMVIILQTAIKNNILTIPSTVTTLSYGQINSFPQITTVEVPESVTNINGAFFWNNNITNIIIDSNNPKYEVIGKAIYTKESTGEDLEIVKYFGNEDTVDIKEGIKTIKTYCFTNKSLNQIKLPNSLKKIESQAFANCNNLKRLSLGPNVESFNNMSIYGLSIEKLEINEDNPNYSIRKGSICNGEETEALYNKDGSIFVSPIKPIGTIITYEIPSKVKEIADYAFHSQSLTNIVIPNTVEKIGASFNVCSSLTSIEIPNSIKEINTSCFNNSPNLKEIRIHKKKDEIKGSPWGCIYGDKAIIWDE